MKIETVYATTEDTVSGCQVPPNFYGCPNLCITIDDEEEFV